MHYNFLGKAQLKVSRTGLGGHYKAMEEGMFEERYAYVDREVAPRVQLVSRALEAGINYFDSTWRNETAMLGTILNQLGARDQAVVNGMVLGAFSGAKAAGVSVEEYFNRWLDARLPLMPGNHFDVFMINAIEEAYDEASCERLVRLMEKRRAQGDFTVMAFSCHDPFHARRVADRFPQFEAVMLPYNYHNRRFEAAFAGYGGSASFIVMKPLVWLEYGIPFCAINALPDFHGNFGFDPDPKASASALRFTSTHPLVTTTICAVNSPAELENLILAGGSDYTQADDDLLQHYQLAISLDKCIPLYLGALEHDNLRMNYFGALHLSRILGVKMPEIPLNQPDSQAQIQGFAAELAAQARVAGYQRYFKNA